MRVLHIVLAVSIISVTIAECGTSSGTIPPASLVEKPTPMTIPQAENVTFCDLVSSPQIYNQKIVRTEAIAAVMTFEVAFLYDPKCNTKDAWIDYEFEDHQAFGVTDSLLSRDFGKNTIRRARLTLVGRVRGPSREGYGHLNTSRLQFLILAVEKAEGVLPNLQITVRLLSFHTGPTAHRY